MIHEYFKREFEDFTIIVQLNPKTFEGVELTIYKDKTVEKRKMQFDSDIYEDFNEDGFKPSSPIEFNLYLKGIS
ncbi:hypothetical protein [Fulvivirga lutea]|uniref:Uncharacterized protein n=1 Tax=Fulvivirga lutea TaxID=2810512 RepID=A0A974WE88_9BACT|nr:hypothetical protein [Fulvivirga lutea]QSE96150.1 hypothetical protein JR347_11050 [Fulvivirga lutea]